MTRLAGTRAWVADVVRSGLGTPEEASALVVEAIAADHPEVDADETARAWIAEALDQWRDQTADWPAVTDYDRLQDAFAALEADRIVVLQGCSDHWAAHDELARTTARGIAWFTPPDVWHAIDEGMLEVNLWHSTTANAAPGDALLEDVLAAFRDAGLDAKFDEGRIEVSAYWQRRPS
ncbi:MAG: hypothetical protein JWR52_1667 [Marmoricola sp.]|nr:hypothetical protein [Marmoricola sp.]